MKKTAIVLSALFLFSCSGKENTSVNTKSNFKISDCLEKFDFDFCKMLTQQDILKHYKIDFSKTKVDSNSRTGQYGECIYQWESDRSKISIEISKTKMIMPDMNRLGIDNLFLSSKDLDQESILLLFDRGYKSLPETEINQEKENLKDKIKDEERLKTALDLMDMRGKFAYKPISGIGNGAYWKWKEPYGGELVVLVGRAKFTIISRVSLDIEENLELSKKLALEVIGKCN